MQLLRRVAIESEPLKFLFHDTGDRGHDRRTELTLRRDECAAERGMHLSQLFDEKLHVAAAAQVLPSPSATARIPIPARLRRRP